MTADRKFGKYTAIYEPTSPKMAEFEEQFPDQVQGPREHYLVRFNSGFGASILRGGFAHPPDLWEVAVILWDGPDMFETVFKTPVGIGVVGGLNDDGVTEVLEVIEAFDETTPFIVEGVSRKGS